MKKVTKKILNNINKLILVDNLGAFYQEFGEKAITIEKWELERIAKKIAEKEDEIKEVESKIFDYINALLKLKGYKKAYDDEMRYYYAHLKDGSLEYLVYEQREPRNLCEDLPEGFE